MVSDKHCDLIYNLEKIQLFKIILLYICIYWFTILFSCLEICRFIVLSAESQFEETFADAQVQNFKEGRGHIFETTSLLN